MRQSLQKCVFFSYLQKVRFFSEPGRGRLSLYYSDALQKKILRSIGAMLKTIFFIRYALLLGTFPSQEGTIRFMFFFTNPRA